MPSSDDASILHVGQPNVGDRKLFDRLVDDIFDRRWFTNNGQLVQEFETRLSEFLGVKHCIATCNATVGLQIACHALELTGEVILPAFTFVATAHAVEWERLTPVFADIDPATHNIDPASIESRITENTSAILGVHVWGRPCDTDAISAIAEKHGLVTMYDAAHAFACKHQGRMIGNFGKCEVFSFHATKFFNTFEGGAIATNDDVLAKKIRLMKNFGFSGQDNVIHLGTNGKMPEICAAMGLANFAAISDFLVANQANHLHYQQGLSNVSGIRLLEFGDQEKSNWQYVVLEVDECVFGRTRDELAKRLQQQGVQARRYFYPGCHRMEPYATRYPEQIERLPNADRLCRQVLCLPNGTGVSKDDISRICQIILKVASTAEAAV